MKFLFIGAHPDDVEFSCGGTILRLIDKGHDVYMVVMSGGSKSLNGTEDERKQEQLNAFRFSKAKRLFILDYEDGAISATAESIREISGILDIVKPNLVITHHPDDSHQDHRNVSAIVKSATRRRCNLMYFDSYSSIGFEPNLYIDISEFANGKVKLLKHFHSQITKYADRNIDFIRKSLLINEVNGYECKCPFAEGFVVDTYMI